MKESRLLVVSVVSHGHGVQVQGLLEQLARSSAAQIARVVVTQNMPEPVLQAPVQGWPFQVDILRNARPLGFGANHNQALKGACEPFVCVLNPDVELIAGQEPFEALLHAAAQPGVGCAYPRQLDDAGRLQDSEREMPTPLALWRRCVMRKPQRRVDWVNAACIVLPLPIWQAVHGFDESYFMYCEDVDLCLRVRLAGGRLQRAEAHVVHAGQHASHRQFRHLLWHVRSLLRLWMSSTYWRMRE